jgi:hypothetical protein
VTRRVGCDSPVGLCRRPRRSTFDSAGPVPDPLRRPNRTLLLAVSLAAASAGAAMAQQGPSTIDAFTVSGGELTPPASCHDGACTVAMQVSRPIERDGTVGFVDPSTGERLRGTFHVIYGLYSFHGELAFSGGPDGRAVLDHAAGAGSAAAAWSMSFTDAERSTLIGRFLAPSIVMSRVGTGAAAAMRLAVEYTVHVSSGTGRFAGQTSACGTAGCKFSMTSTTPGAALAKTAAAASRNLAVKLRAGRPRALIAMAPGTVLDASDTRRLQVSVAPGSSCEAEAVPAGPSARAAQAAPIQLGTAKAGPYGAANWTEGLYKAAVRQGLARSAQAGQDETALRLEVTCTKPGSPDVRASRVFRMHAEF